MNIKLTDKEVSILLNQRISKSTIGLMIVFIISPILLSIIMDLNGYHKTTIILQSLSIIIACLAGSMYGRWLQIRTVVEKVEQEMKISNNNERKPNK